MGKIDQNTQEIKVKGIKDGETVKHWLDMRCDVFTMDQNKGSRRLATSQSLKSANNVMVLGASISLVLIIAYLIYYFFRRFICRRRERFITTTDESSIVVDIQP